MDPRWAAPAIAEAWCYATISLSKGYLVDCTRKRSSVQLRRSQQADLTECKRRRIKPSMSLVTTRLRFIEPQLATSVDQPPEGPAIGHYPPPGGNDADAPPPDGYYADAPPPDGNYADAPPPESYGSNYRSSD